MTDQELAPLIDQYPFRAEWTIVPGDSGMNNTTRMIQSGDDRFVLRVYNNHRDEDIVSLEHHVLFALSGQQTAFKVPLPIRNRAGETISRTKDGALAAMYRYIPGVRPTAQNPEHIRSLGETAAKLSAALQDMTITRKPMYDPYYSIEETYSSLIKEELPVIMQASELLTPMAQPAAEIEGQLKSLSDRLTSLKELPHQWIHGDLNFSNTVANGDSIIGVLDFEFCTMDVRAMEAVVALVDFFQGEASEILGKIRLFCEGYGKFGKLTIVEAEALPLLIKLRVLDVFLHFTNRFKEGLDEAPLLAGFIDSTSRICKWVDENEEQLVTLFRHELTAG